MKLKIFAAAFVIGLSVVTYKVATNDPVRDIVQQLTDGKPVTLDSGKVYNFSGYKDIPVTAPFNLNHATIKCDSMLQVGFNDNHYLFRTNSRIHNGTIRGSSGRSDALQTGYFGAIEATTGAVIENMKFVNCDKWAVIALGDKFSLTDTIWITNCVFDSIARNGSGYDINNRYGTVVITGNEFKNSRHCIDMGGSPNPVCIIRNNTFRSCFFISINQHKIDGTNKCGAGLEIVGNYFFDKYKPMQLAYPHSGVIRIDSNYFAGNIIGTVEDSIIPTGTNYMNGEKMPIGAKIIASKKVFQVNEQITLKASGKDLTWSNGSHANQITTRGSMPMVRVFSCYSRGLTDTVTILVQGSGKYTGFRAMAHKNEGKIEVWRGSEKIQSVVAAKFLNYNYFMFNTDSVKIRCYAPIKISFDDYVANAEYYQTFETGVDGLRISYKNGAGSASRQLYNVSSGYRNLTVEVSSGWIEVGR